MVLMSSITSPYFVFGRVLKLLSYDPITHLGSYSSNDMSGRFSQEKLYHAAAAQLNSVNAFVLYVLGIKIRDGDKKRRSPTTVFKAYTKESDIFVSVKGTS